MIKKTLLFLLLILSLGTAYHPLRNILINDSNSVKQNDITTTEAENSPKVLLCSNSIDYTDNEFLINEIAKIEIVECYSLGCGTVF